MKAPFLTLIILLIAISGFNQNLLPFSWKISRKDISLTEVQNPNVSDWEEINLLRSWEWQGFSWQDEACVLMNNFTLDELKDDLQLVLALQCDVKNIYINNTLIGSDFSNTFWSSRGKKNYLDIPKKALKTGKNQIVIFVANLSYTGGLSHNICKVQPKNSKVITKVDIRFPVDDHVFFAPGKVKFTVNFEGAPGKINLIIKDDFHKVWLNKTYPVLEMQRQVQVDLQKLNLKPGFYECIALFDNGTYAGDIEWFSLQPEKIICNTNLVEGYYEYWDKALDELKEIEPNFRMHKVDSLCSDTRDGYVVEMQSMDTLTIRAYYFVPKTGGEHPVVLHMPGYSYGFEHVDDFLNRQGNTAELALCIRGHGISKDVFNPWPEMTFWAVRACSLQKNVYRATFMDCVRAVDFLLSRPEIDKDKIGVAGGSQGGGLSIATAALCNENIAACAVFDPFLADTRDQMKIRKIVKRELTAFLEYPENNCALDQLLHVQDFIDVRGLASKIQCPVHFQFSLFDDDCPVHCGFAAYNLIPSKKMYTVYPNDSHMGESGQYENLFTEVEKLLIP